MPFNIIICGAGLAGLGAAIALRKKGHRVTVLEGAPQLAEVGAGIQIPPNSSRILKAYGVYEEIEKVIVWPQNINFRRYATGDVIGQTPLHPTLSDRYGFPYWLIHRADYQQCLFDHAKKEGVKVLLNSFVERVDDAGPSVTLASGQTLAADIVIGADGIRSRTRECILGGEDVQPVDSSNCAFRATVPRQAMVEDATVAHLMDDINANCWIGHQRHIMAYPIRNGALYNLVMSHPGRAAVGRWNEPGDLAAMRQHYADFDPAVRRVLAKVSACLKWKLADLPPLPRWVSSTGRVVLIGDAAHAMVPYMAQGAAQSIEDGAALAECLERAGGDLAAVPAALGAFEQIRKPRCDVVQAASRSNGDIWHMPDGPAQERRDREMLGVMRGELNGSGDDESSAENPNRWSDESFQPWLFGYDTVAETNKALDEIMGASTK